MEMILHFILFKKTHILNQSILKKNLTYLQNWFYVNYMVLNNPVKCYCMTFVSNTTKKEFVFEDDTILPSVEERVVLGIKINSYLIFYSHLKQFYERWQIN